MSGPRQSGKSTLLAHTFPDYPSVTFDDPDEVLAFHQDPRGFLARYTGPVILDEVQKIPALAREDQVWTGGYPSLVTRHFDGARDWYASYLATYLEKDVRMVFDIGKLTDFQILVRLLAARTGQELNTASLAKEIGVSAKTVDSWISVLEAGYIVFKLLPYHANLGKRLIKRPKVYFWDTGLVGALTPKAEWSTKMPHLNQVATDATIIYRGETKHAWPRPGINYLNWQDLA